MGTLYKNVHSRLVIIPCTPTIVVQVQAFSSKTKEVSWYIADIPKYVLNQKFPRQYLQDSIVISMYEKKGKEKASHKLAWELMSAFRSCPESLVVYTNRIWAPDICKAFRKKKFKEFILHEPQRYPEIPTEKKYLRMVSFKDENLCAIQTIQPDFVIVKKVSLS